MQFMIQKCGNKREMSDMQRRFRELDRHSDEVLCIDDLKQGYYEQMQDRFKADEIVEAIFERYDKDGCGHINYTEWVLATISKQSLLTHDKLKKAFLEFDTEEDGCVQALTVKDILCQGNNIDDDIWECIIAETDHNGNGEIDFEEFTEMMTKLLSDKWFETIDKK